MAGFAGRWSRTRRDLIPLSGVRVGAATGRPPSDTEAVTGYNSTMSSVTTRPAPGLSSPAVPDAVPPAWSVPRADRAGTAVISTIGYVCLLIALPLVVWNAIRITPGMTYGDPMLVLAAGAALLVHLDRRQPTTALPTWLWMVGAILMATGLVATFRTTTEGNLLPLVRMVVTLTVLPPIMAVLLSTPARVRTAAEVWLLGAAICAFVAIVDFELNLGINTDLTGVDFQLYTDRAAGLTVHPNHLGLTSAMAFPIAVMLATRAGATGTWTVLRLRFAVYGVVLFGAIILCGSRAAPVAAVLGLVVALIVADRRLRSPVLVGGLIVVVLGLGLVVIGAASTTGGPVVLERLSGDSTAQLSDQDREGKLTVARTAIEENPFIGQGYSVVRTAHIMFLQLLQAGGLFAVGAFMFMFLAYLSDARWLARLGDLPPPDRVLVAGLAGSVAAWAAAGFVTNAVYDRYLYLPFGLLLAIRAITMRGAWASPRSPR